MKTMKRTIFLAIAICMLFSTGMMVMASQMDPIAFNEAWYSDLNSGGWAARTPKQEKTSRSSVWLQNTGSHFTASVWGYKRSTGQYADCSNGYTYGIPTGGTATMYNFVNEWGYEDAAVRMVLTDAANRYTRATGSWKPDI